MCISTVRTLTNSVTEAYRDDLWGHGPDDFPREVIGHEDERPIYKFSTDSPLRNMTVRSRPMPNAKPL